MVRAGRDGEDEPTCIESSLAVIGFKEVPSLGSATSREDIRAIVEKAYPESSKSGVSNITAQLHAFVNRMDDDDLIALPRKQVNKIALGRIEGPYSFQDIDGVGRHTRPVKWIKVDLPRSAFEQDLLYSLGAFMTVCQIRRNDAEYRMAIILEDGADPGAVPDDLVEGGDEAVLDNKTVVDIETLASEQVRDYIELNFKGHELTRLIDGILKADGYFTYVSPPGPDGGVDILAGRGNLGLEEQKLCVQVKSSVSPCDVNVFRALQGTMQTFQADQGLLVSWGGFTKTARRESTVHFFSIRLWDSRDIIRALHRSYEKLSDDLKADLPLKRIWTMVLDE